MRHKPIRVATAMLMERPRLEDFDLRFFCYPSSLQKNGQRPHVVGTEHHVDPRRSPDDFTAILLRKAPADCDLHAGLEQL